MDIESEDLSERVVRVVLADDHPIVREGLRLLDAEAAADLPAPDVLSDREREVLMRIAQGFSNKEIAAALALSVKTVETYKARVMEKLELRSRVDMVRYAARQGWLGPTTDAPSD